MASVGQQGLVLGQDVLSRGDVTLVQIHHGGEAMFWMVFGLMATSAIGIGLLTGLKPPGHRSNGYCTTIVLTIASCAYFAMATQGGSASVTVYSEVRTARAIYYARYVDWFLTTPLLLLDILLLSGVAFADAIWILVADVGMIVTGLFGALLPNRYKWGWFGIGCLFMLFIFWGLLVHARRCAMRRSKALGGVYTALSLYLIVLWFVYPVVWGFAEGSNTISSNAEAYWYGILDVLTKVVFGWSIVLFIEPILKKVRHEEEGVPSVLASPMNGLLTGGEWAPGTAYHTSSATTSRRVAPSADDDQPVAVEQPTDAAHGPKNGISAKDHGTGMLHKAGAGPNIGGNPTGTLHAV